MAERPGQVLLADQAWRAVVAGDAVARPDLRVDGPPLVLASRFDVDGVAVAAVAAALMAASALDGGADGPASVAVDRAHVVAAVRSERSFEAGDRPMAMGFHPLSRFWQAADGWVRTHANAPWHRRAMLAALGADPEAAEADPEAIAAGIAGRPAVDVAERIVAAGGVAAATGVVGRWQRAHPQGVAVAAEPLVSHQRIGDAPARPRTTGDLPASGIRVLDLTRVIAGPVCTRTLGALGADVLRIDPPGLPDLPRGAPSDTLLGKRSAALDLADPEARRTFESLLDDADVVVQGYRPGSLAARFGLAPEALAERHPGLVIVVLAAWGHSGPWANRRGFDSVVQAPTGIALAESGDGMTPGALPCQLLDHGTGHLAAAAVLDGLRRQRDVGGTHVRRLSLARTAAWLTGTVGAGVGATTPTDDPARWVVTLPTAVGDVRAVAPPGAIGGVPLQWPGPPARYCQDPPTWSASGAAGS